MEKNIQLNLFQPVQPVEKIITEEDYRKACLTIKSYQSQLLKTSFVKGKVNHINGTLRQVIKRNKEDILTNKEENIQSLLHCIGQLNIL